MNQLELGTDACDQRNYKIIIGFGFPSNWLREF